MILCAIEQEISYHKHHIDLDETLLEQIGQGSGEAFETLYHATDRAVFGFALSIVKNPHDAEDVMQDTYLQIRRYANSYRPQGKPMAWILTIVKHLALSHLSSRRCENIDEQHHLAQEGDQYEAAENRLLLQTLFKTLTDEERRIVVLHAQTGMKHREIAEILEMPLSTVLSKYVRAIGKLKHSIQV